MATKPTTPVEMLRIALDANYPVILVGDSGVGKTAAVTAEAAQRGWPTVALIGAQIDPTDVGGLPVRNGETIQYLAGERFDVLYASEPSVLFIDELTSAPPAVMAALLRVINERELAGKPLSPECRVVCAANPPEMAANGADLPVPMLTRLMHVSWVLDLDELVEGFVARGWVPGGRAVQDQAVKIAAFLSAMPNLANACPKDALARQAPFACPRSWAALARIMAVATDPDMAIHLAPTVVGQEAGVAFASWLHDQAVPNPDALLADPTIIRPLVDRGDVVQAALLAMVARVLRATGAERKGLLAKAQAVLVEALDASDRDDLVMPSLTMLVRHGQLASVDPRLTRLADLLLAKAA